MMSENPSTHSDCEIVTSRILNVTIEDIYKAWSNPKHLQNWWGPKGFTNSFTEFDFRVGGKWQFIMHGPEKGNYPNECEFTQINPPYLIAWKRISKPLFQVQVTFEETTNTSTKIVFKMIFDTAEECNKLKPFVVDKNEENIDKLEIELLKMNS